MTSLNNLYFLQMEFNQIKEGTPYEGGVFHMKITFPNDYPATSPSVSIFTPLPHPHVYGYRICLDLLSDYENYFVGKNCNGWSAAYSVLTILLQLQSYHFNH